MHIYMKTEKIPGSATDTKHKNWIELESFDLSIDCPSPMKTGNMGDRQYSLPKFIAPYLY